MSQQFRAKTLEDAYEQATASLNCSITDLDIQIVQSHSNGFFGLFSKEAIITVKLKKHIKSKDIKKEHKPKNIQKPKTQDIKVEKKSEQIFDDFYDKKHVNQPLNKLSIKKDNTILEDIKLQINDLFNLTCYELDEIKVDFYDDETIYIEFSGKDAALLIGKEGYRYKALSYILFNWIHEKYNMMLRLEVAQFLVSQEEAIATYLIPVIQTIKEDGFYKTKPLDGVLVHIALKTLRDEFPDKYVAVKTNIKGDKYILVNEYRK